MTTTSYSGSDFIQSLKDESNSPETIITLQGMAKESEDSDDVLMFSPSRSCEAWIEISVSKVENVTVLGRTTCKDHDHPIVELSLKTDNSVEGQLLRQLLAFYKSTATAQHAPMPVVNSMPNSHAAAATMLHNNPPLSAHSIAPNVMGGIHSIGGGCGGGGRRSGVCLSGCICDFGGHEECCQIGCCFG